MKPDYTALIEKTIIESTKQLMEDNDIEFDEQTVTQELIEEAGL